MIDVKITGTYPVVNTDFSVPMEKIGNLMFDSVMENFLAGGRPNQWAPLKKTGEPSFLIQSGRLMNSLVLDTGQYFAMLSTNVRSSKGAPYGVYLNFGTKKMIARQFMMFQEMDKTDILQILGSAIFNQSERTI